jgi:lipopolysaccharide export system permease protein
MPRILYRYLLRRMVLSWLGLSLFLMTIMSIGQVPTILERAAEHQIATGLILRVMWWMMLANAPILLLLTLMLAIVVTLGRLGHESELTAMAAVGFSPLNMLLVVAMLALPVVALQAGISLRFAPQAFCSAVQARNQAARNLALAPVHAGQFLQVGGNRTLFVQEVGADGELRKVFAISQTEDGVDMLTAETGRVSPDLGTDRLRLQLFDGKRYSGIPGQRRFQIVQFAELNLWLPLPVGATACVRPDTRTVAELWGSSKGADRAELNSRIGFVVMTVILALAALVLSRNRPRTGLFIRLPAALGIFIVYLFAEIGVTGWSAKHAAHGSLAYWSLHAFAAAVVIAGFVREQWPRRHSYI